MEAVFPSSKLLWLILPCWAMLAFSHEARAEDESEKPLYETEPDSEVLKAERMRLKAEKKEIKAEKKKAKKRRRELGKELTQLEDRYANKDALGLTEDEVVALDQRLAQLRVENREVVERIEEIDEQISQLNRGIKGTKNLWALPYVAPAYSPELGLLFVAGGFFSFKTNRLDKDIKRSTMPVVAGISSTGAAVVNLRLISFWWHDRLRVNADFWLKNMPDHYWGVGYEAGRSPSDEDDDLTGYDRLWWQFHPLFLFRIYAPHLYLGWNIDINQTVADNVNEAMAEDPSFLEFGNNNFNAGMGANLTYDSRDVPTDPHHGVFLSGTATFYGDYLGSDNRYQVYEADYRQYQTIVHEGSTLAWQVRSRYAVGDVPYGEMSFLGNPFDFRGYYWGRYRDRTILYGIIEYRYMFRPPNPARQHSLFGRHGLVGWVGYGSLGDGYAEMTNWLPSFGTGYRAQLQPRVNLRVDLAFGNDSYFFYINFNESF